MEIFTWLAGVDWASIITVVLAVFGAASVAVHAIAPLTSNTIDDEAASFIDKVYAFLLKLSLNKDTSKK